MSQKGLERLRTLRDLNANPHWVNGDLYRLMYMRDLYVTAYQRIRSEPGNMTPGSDGETIDEFSMNSIERIIDAMKSEKFQFTRSRRVYIPKANGKTRPLGIPSAKDKVVQEVVRMIIESIYDSNQPTFLDYSHGFRPNRGTHSCLKEISSWHAMSWFVEGDIKACFDSIDHHKLIEVLRKRISDERFLSLIWKALTAGYMEGKVPHNSLSGTPQGSIISPILANVFLHEFDVWMDLFIQKHDTGKDKRINPAYTKIVKRRQKLLSGKAKVSEEERIEELRTLSKELRKLPSKLHNDPASVRIRYARYADDWIVGIDGPKELASNLKEEATRFFKESLGLELSPEKTYIRNARSEEAFFLGTRLRIGRDSTE